MAKRGKKKKKKLKIKNILLFLFILSIIGYLFFLLSKMPVKGYFISGNTYYTDQEILDMTGLDKYPSFLFTTSKSINEKIKDNKIIKNIKIKKTYLGRFNVIVNEKKILFYDLNKKVSITNEDEKIDYYNSDSPVLINEINDKKIEKRFLKKMKLVSNNILVNISEIKYDPNDIDKERFLVSMNDGNYIYLTLSKFSKINDYIKISRTIGDRNGILYLDYGNYFVPKQ